VICTLDHKIDVFVHETTTVPVQGDAQLEALEGHMAEQSVFRSLWATPQFADYAAKNGRRLLMHKESPFVIGIRGLGRQ
jgi:hypothetical protein